MSLGSIGALGLGSALGNSLSSALKLGDQYQQYQADRYNDASNQIAQYQKNAAVIAEGRANQLAAMAKADGLSHELLQPRLGEVNPYGQNMYPAQGTLQATLANDPTYTGNIPQQISPETLQGVISGDGTIDYAKMYMKYLNESGGNIGSSMQGVLNGG